MSVYRVYNDEQVKSFSSSTEVSTNLDDIRFEIISSTNDELIVDLIGADVSMANALRRIMLAEVPTIAVEDVYIGDNSSIMQDEVLAHRVGLIPLKINPDMLEFMNPEEGETDADTVILSLEAYWPNEKDDTVGLTGVNVKDEDGVVSSKHLKYTTVGGQNEKFEAVEAVHQDIPIAKLRPGQKIEFEAHCRKGIGKDHAKFSPVATASYRLRPKVSLMTEITDKDAEFMKDKCPQNVFDIEDLVSSKSNKVGTKKLIVNPDNERSCNMCRECIRHPGWEEKIKLEREGNHFIFSIETAGSMPPIDILRAAINVLRTKAQNLQGVIAGYEEANL